MIVERSPGVAWVDSGDRIVLLRLDRLADDPLVLEGSGAAVWRLLDESVDMGELVDAVAETFGAAAGGVERDVRRFLDSASELGAVVLREPA